MPRDENQEFVDSIVMRDRNTLQLLDIYHQQKKEIKKLKKQNQFFIKQWDKRNLVATQSAAKKDKLLEQQSKMAAMGEMMDAVAHQWKQPLNAMSMMSSMLKNDFKNGLINQEYIDDITDTSALQIEHMLTTLKEFRNFFRPSTKEVSRFHLITCIDSVQLLMKDELLSHGVNIHINIGDNISIVGLKNEFKHLILNLISNSIDAFEEKNLTQRDIYIKAYQEDEKVYLEIEDNAGGIPNSVIRDIFKPNVTTKEIGKGTGIGLYMSSQIVQKLHGKINVHNSDRGALFTIILNS